MEHLVQFKNAVLCFNIIIKDHPVLVTLGVDLRKKDVTKEKINLRNVKSRIDSKLDNPVYDFYKK
jgi:hypothetical protein